MLKKILIVIAVLIGGVLVLATTQPESFNVKRSIAIKAPAAKVFVMIDDFHHWSAWSPW